MNLRFSLRTLLLMLAGSACAIGAPYWIPKRQVLAFNDAYVGYYHGLGLIHGRGYFGRDWYRVVVHEDRDGYWEVDVKGLGYNEYRGYYLNGRLREEGLCMVAENVGNGDIYPDRHDILDGKFYDPSGALVSEVKNKTGKQILCYDNGQPFWELDLVNGQYRHVKMWHTNGQLRLEEGYQDGTQHGMAESYYSNGQLRFRGTYDHGEQRGVWVRFAEDGRLESKIDYGPADAQ